MKPVAMIPARAEAGSIRSAMENESIIIGVTGHPASGKDTVADYLVSQGFFKISGGDILREEMQKLGIPIDRSRVHEFVNEMRKKRGNGYLAEEAIKKIKGNAVVSGIRNSEEIRIFREKLGNAFKLIAVQTPIEARYVRAKERGRIGDAISFERFKAEEEKEKAAESGSHEVDRVMALADITMSNDGSKEDLFRKIDAFFFRSYRISRSATDNNMITLGKYRHYKGKEYEVIGIAKHSETKEELVVYRALYGEGGMWARPLVMFMEEVEVEGESVPRFQYLDDSRGN